MNLLKLFVKQIKVINMESIEDLYDENPLDMKISEHIEPRENTQKHKFEGQYTNQKFFETDDLGDILPDIYENPDALPILKELYLNSAALQSQYSSFNAMYNALAKADEHCRDPFEYDKYCQIINELSDSYTDSPFDLAKFKKIFKDISIKND